MKEERDKKRKRKLMRIRNTGKNKKTYDLETYVQGKLAGSSYIPHEFAPLRRVAVGLSCERF